GDDAEEFKKIALVSGITMNFHGFLSREKVFDIYKNTHFFLLPSTASEGFPKVIAEAMNFGCIPVVSDVSSIGQYINKENGYICSPATANELLKIIERILISPEEEIHQKALNGTNVSKHFTFQNYNNRIKKEVLTTESKYTLRY
ncbi:glycosyltransferase, partial [Lutibacter sp.]